MTSLAAEHIIIKDDDEYILSTIGDWQQEDLVEKDFVRCDEETKNIILPFIDMITQEPGLKSTGSVFHDIVIPFKNYVLSLFYDHNTTMEKKSIRNMIIRLANECAIHAAHGKNLPGYYVAVRQMLVYRFDKYELKMIIDNKEVVFVDAVDDVFYDYCSLLGSTSVDAGQSSSDDSGGSSDSDAGSTANATTHTTTRSNAQKLAQSN